jgi:hypothetical protein
MVKKLETNRFLSSVGRRDLRLCFEDDLLGLDNEGRIELDQVPPRRPVDDEKAI